MTKQEILNKYHITNDNSTFPIENWDCFYKLYSVLCQSLKEEEIGLLTTYCIISTIPSYDSDSESLKKEIVELNLNDYRTQFLTVYNFVKTVFSEFSYPINNSKSDSYEEMYKNNKMLVSFVYALSDYCQNGYIKLENIETELYNITLGVGNKSENSFLKELASNMIKKDKSFMSLQQYYEGNISMTDIRNGVEYNDFGEYLEEVINNCTTSVKREIIECLEMYLNEQKIEFNYNIPISFLLNRLVPINKELLLQNIEAIIDDPDAINEGAEMGTEDAQVEVTDDQSNQNGQEEEPKKKEEKKEDKFEYLKFGGFVTFNKILTKIGTSESKVEILEGDLSKDDFILRVNIPADSVAAYNAFSIYQGYEPYVNILSANKGSETKLYYLLKYQNSSLFIEYGMDIIKYNTATGDKGEEEKVIIGGFKLTSAIHKNLFTTKNQAPSIWLGYLNSKVFKNESFDMKGYMKTIKLAIDFKNFKPDGFDGQNSKMFIVNKDLNGFELNYSFEGLGTWQNGTISEDDLTKYKGIFVEFILENSWKKNVLYAVMPDAQNKFWLSFVIKNRA